MLATDHDPIALRFAAHNAAINDVQVDGFELLDWHHARGRRRFDRVLAADVLYQRVDHAAILKCLDSFLTSDGLGVIADPNRSVADRFPGTAREAGFQVEMRKTAALNPAGERVDGRVFMLRRMARI